MSDLPRSPMKVDPRGEERRKIARVASAAVLALIIAGPACGTNPLPRRISHYRGDGEISRIPFLLNQGFKIDLEEFSFSEECHARYSLAGVPRHPTGYHVGIAFSADPNPLRQLDLGGWGEGSLRVAVQDARGGTLVDLPGSLDHVRWSYVGEGMFVYSRKREDGSIEEWHIPAVTVRDAADLPLTLEVWHTPPAGAPSLPVRIRLAAGGYKRSPVHAGSAGGRGPGVQARSA